MGVWPIKACHYDNGTMSLWFSVGGLHGRKWNNSQQRVQKRKEREDEEPNIKVMLELTFVLGYGAGGLEEPVESSLGIFSENHRGKSLIVAVFLRVE